MESTIEVERAHSIADEYRRKGYEVIEQPSVHQLPEFLQAFHPDVLARKGDESVVIEVRSRASLVGDERVKDLTRLLQSKPGWRLELVVIGSNGDLSIAGSGLPDRDEVIAGRKEIEGLLDAGFHEAALVRAWSNLEGALRLVADEEGVVASPVPSNVLLTTLVSEGILARTDYNLLVDAMRTRNAVAHGYKATDVTPELVHSILSITQRMLS